MPEISTLLLFAGAAFVLAVMPGPGLLYIAGRTLAAGRGDGLASCVGSALGGLVHVVAGAVGVSALIMTSATAFGLLKTAGGLYLLYLGLQTWLAAETPVTPVGSVRHSSPWRAVRQGAVVEATNPKTAVFFLALIPQFIDADQGSVALQFGILGLISIALNTGMALVVVGLASALRARLSGRERLLRRLRRASGMIFGGLGASLLLAHRPV